MSMNLDLRSCEAVDIPEGTFFICHSDKNLSAGFLRLNPNSKLSKHSRPVEEWLLQVEGTTKILLYENSKIIKEALLKRGDAIKIPANQFHQHTNPEDSDSLTSWRVDGDITKIIEEIRARAK